MEKWKKILEKMIEGKKIIGVLAVGLIAGIVFMIGLGGKHYETKQVESMEEVYAIEDTLVEAKQDITKLEAGVGTVFEEAKAENEDIVTKDPEEDKKTSPYDDIAIACVSNYVNVRTKANTDAEIVGKIYDGAAATILETVEVDGEAWYKIQSGNVEGYMKAEYFVTGDEASKLADTLACKRAVVITETLFVRNEPSVESKVVDMVPVEAAYPVEEEMDEFVRITTEKGITGYVSKEFVNIDVEFDTAISIIEEQEAEEAKRLREEEDKIKEEQRKQEEQQEKKEENTDHKEEQEDVQEETQNTDNVQEDKVEVQQSSNDTRTNMIEYARQFLGNPYVWGGNSLEKGTDCSGFVMLIYQHYGYSLSRIPSGQYAGIGDVISLEECQPGDIVLYGTSSSNLTHSAIYIGNGQVIHEANRRMGVCISDAKTFGKIYGCKKILD